uniref:Uncharacterized protein n=1 Tax=Chromera velia CCMP2878 TaxID=1169474 RepID=A0A0G4HC64_9ALVE|eukprot:Cvel_25998.t1-p1 / transcript=Cvel_25998.t1 / gene=Cvel_25998 / organism=Chromera_velia_CCMP2878 / gene_product=hypothetical protein / transcript_product=hypothetical protein / location=Cvel_scaffold3024:6376-17114(+) / protein_length=753 / sequence_SO=supercontig / SO=protein_coding / is_pseudo=false
MLGDFNVGFGRVADRASSIRALPSWPIGSVAIAVDDIKAYFPSLPRADFLSFLDALVCFLSSSSRHRFAVLRKGGSVFIKSAGPAVREAWLTSVGQSFHSESDATMEVCVTGAEGVPDKAFLSIRVGETRRQAPFRLNESFKFPSLNHENMKVDIFQMVGGSQVPLASLKSEGDVTEKVELQTENNESGSPLVLNVRAKASAALEIGPKGTAKPSRHQAAMMAQQYLEAHKLQGVLQKLVQQTLMEKPEEPLVFMKDLLTKIKEERDEAAKKAAAAAAKKKREEEARRKALLEEERRRRAAAADPQSVFICHGVYGYGSMPKAKNTFMKSYVPEVSAKAEKVADEWGLDGGEEEASKDASKDKEEEPKEEEPKEEEKKEEQPPAEEEEKKEEPPAEEEKKEDDPPAEEEKKEEEAKEEEAPKEEEGEKPAEDPPAEAGGKEEEKPAEGEGGGLDAAWGLGGAPEETEEKKEEPEEKKEDEAEEEKKDDGEAPAGEATDSNPLGNWGLGASEAPEGGMEDKKDEGETEEKKEGEGEEEKKEEGETEEKKDEADQPADGPKEEEKKEEDGKVEEAAAAWFGAGDSDEKPAEDTKEEKKEEEAEKTEEKKTEEVVKVQLGKLSDVTADDMFTKDAFFAVPFYKNENVDEVKRDASRRTEAKTGTKDPDSGKLEANLDCTVELKAQNEVTLYVNLYEDNEGAEELIGQVEISITKDSPMTAYPLKNIKTGEESGTLEVLVDIPEGAEPGGAFFAAFF